MLNVPTAVATFQDVRRAYGLVSVKILIDLAFHLLFEP